MMKTVSISYEDYMAYTTGLGNPGVCLACGMVDEYADCEPDAENYPCPECEEEQMFGLETALVSGDLVIEDEE